MRWVGEVAQRRKQSAAMTQPPPPGSLGEHAGRVRCRVVPAGGPASHTPRSPWTVARDRRHASPRAPGRGPSQDVEAVVHVRERQ